MLLLATGLSIVLYGALPKWLGWIAILLGVIGLTPIGFFAFLGRRPVDPGRQRAAHAAGPGTPGSSALGARHSGTRSLTYAAFLRAINLGRKRRVSGADLRAHFEALGLRGRARLSHERERRLRGRTRSPAKLADRIEEALKESLGHEVGVFLRTETEIRALADTSLFPAGRRGLEGKAPGDDAAREAADPDAQGGAGVGDRRGQARVR